MCPRTLNSKSVTKIFASLFFGSAVFWSFSAHALVISEIMYDVPGTDTGREWVEVQNDSDSAISLAEWKFFEADTNHGLTLSKGDAQIPAGKFAVIADNAEKFLIDWPNFAGTLFESSFSLSNTGEAIAFKKDGEIVAEATYNSSSGGAGDGNSLNRNSGGFVAKTPSPGEGEKEGSVTAPPASEPPPAPQTSSPTPASSGTVQEKAIPSIRIDASVPSVAFSSAQIQLSAKGYGIKNEPLVNARYLWSFGDGSYSEGEKVSHVYRFPGQYIAVLNVTSGDMTGSYQKTIDVTESLLALGKFETGQEGFIEIVNPGRMDADVSGWYLKSKDKLFLFPKSTIIKSGAAVRFPATVTSLDADSDSALLYPNGSVAARNIATPPAETAEESKIISEPALPERTAVSFSKSDEEVAVEDTPPIEEPINLPATVVLSDAPSGREWIWLSAMALIVLLSVTGYFSYLFYAKKQEEEQSEVSKIAAEYEIIADKRA